MWTVYYLEKTDLNRYRHYSASSLGLFREKKTDILLNAIEINHRRSSCFLLFRIVKMYCFSFVPNSHQIVNNNDA